MRYYSILLITALLLNSGYVFSSDSDGKADQLKILQQQITELKEKQFYQNQQIETLKEKVSTQKELIDSQTGMLDTAFDGVSAEISAASNFLTVLGIIIGIGSIAIGYYVNRMKENVLSIKRDNEELLLKNIQIKNDLETLSRQITKDSRGLYKIIRDEESNYIIDRLVIVPEDIVNVFSALTSRELHPNQFLKLREAFEQSKNSDHQYKYLMLFFQHFGGLTIFDPILQAELNRNLDDLIQSCFKNDIINAAASCFAAIIEKGIAKSTSEINALVVGISQSKFASMEEVYFSIYQVVTSREDKFLLYSSINKTNKTEPFRKNFGTLLIDYKNAAPSAEENIVITEVENLNKT